MVDSHDSLIFLSYFLLSLTISFLVFPVYINLLRRKNILDNPNSRKIHHAGTPSMGGVIIVISSLFTCFFFLEDHSFADLNYFILAIVLVFIIGLRDDLVPLAPKFKILTQLIPFIIISLMWDDLSISSLYSLIETPEFPLILSVPLTVFTLVIISNSFNLIDGIDGLSGGIGILILSTFAYLINPLNPNLSYVLIAYVGALAGFLIFNWYPASIFMGDTGALVTGFMVACAGIYFINLDSSMGSTYFKGTVTSTICIMAVPLFDTLRVIILRLRSGKSPLEADSNHLHYLLLKLGLNHSKSSLILISLQFLLIALTFLLRYQSDGVVALAMVGVLAMFTIVLNKFSLKRGNL